MALPTGGQNKSDSPFSKREIKQLLSLDCCKLYYAVRTSSWATTIKFATAFINDKCLYFCAKKRPPSTIQFPPFAVTEIESKRHWLSAQSIENRRTNIQFPRLIQQRRDADESFFECDRYSNTQTLIIRDATPGSLQWTFSYYYYYYHHFSFFFSLSLVGKRNSLMHSNGVGRPNSTHQRNSIHLHSGKLENKKMKLRHWGQNWRKKHLGFFLPTQEISSTKIHPTSMR